MGSGSRLTLARPWNPADEDFDRAVDGPTSAVLGAIDEQALAATAMVSHDGHRGRLYYLAVERSRSHRGLGRRMMEHCGGLVRARGAVKLNLMIRSHRAGGQAF